MTLTEFLKSKGAVIEVDVSELPEGLNINQFVEIMTNFQVIDQDVPPVVIKNSKESKEAFKKSV